MVRYDFSPNVTEKFMSHRLVDVSPRCGVSVEGRRIVSDRRGGIKPLARYGTKATRCRPLCTAERSVGVGDRCRHDCLILDELPEAAGVLSESLEATHVTADRESELRRTGNCRSDSTPETTLDLLQPDAGSCLLIR